MEASLPNIRSRPPRGTLLLREVCGFFPQSSAREPETDPYTFRSIYHPAFNLDLEDASDVIERFENHVGAVGRGVQGLRELWGRVREAERGVS